MLRPDAPKQGIPKQQAYAAMFGEERAKMMAERIRAIGAENGISFKSGGKIGATETSHRLIQYAWNVSPEAQDRVVEELFKGYMENEQDITDLKFIAEAGERAGLDKAEVEKYLRSDEGKEEVEEEATNARLAGISGVPNFVINDTFEIGGSQDPAHFIAAFKRAKTVSAE